MAALSKIEWTRSTFNPWVGCTKVSPGCDHCYAAVSTPARTMHVQWGPGAPRHRTSPGNWNHVRKWNRQAAASGEFWPVFTASLADVFDNEVPAAWRADFWALVRECSALTFLVLTKRIGNVRGMLPPDWADGYPNVRLGVTVVNQVEADRDIPKLLATPAALRWLSMEPLLGAVDISRWLEPTGVHCQDVCADTCYVLDSEVETFKNGRGEVEPHCPRCGLGAMWTGYGDGIDWVVVGGESGAGARPMHPHWARSLRDQCAAADVPLLFKQWGEWAPAIERGEGGDATLSVEGVAQFTDKPQWHKFDDGQYMARIGKKAAGRLLDGVLHDGYPEVA